ncbi:MAG: alpha/beta hydrolase fold domain-containing protein [Oscillospiraceae bacterium]|jgi:hypothetical protein|nr:alpha/beta hydrolase fold domain-containing protein [Oscillospiraceae bacterium]
MKRKISLLLILSLLCGAAGLISPQSALAAGPVYTDVSYVTGSATTNQMLDIKLPEGEGPFPVVIYIHGGAWVFGNKSDASGSNPDGIKNPVTQQALLGAGYAFVSIDYRFAQQAPWPAQIFDCKAAVRFLRANAAAYHLDPEKIAVWGSSAGGHLAQFMGVSNGIERFEDLDMGNAGYSGDVQAVISYQGISDLTAWNQPPSLSGLAGLNRPPVTTLLGNGYTNAAALDASPITHVNGNTVPMYIAHSQNDETVQFALSQTLYNKLKTVMDPSLLETYFPALGNHGDADYYDTSSTAQSMINWLNERFASNPDTLPGAPQIKYATIKTTADKDSQALRFYTELSPTPAGCALLEYGTVFVPTQKLSAADVSIEKNMANSVTAGVSLSAGPNIAGFNPSYDGFYANLNGLPGANLCGVRISARSYAVYRKIDQNGRWIGESVCKYSENTERQPEGSKPGAGVYALTFLKNGYATGIKNGVSTRSVNGIARFIAAALIERRVAVNRYLTAHGQQEIEWNNGVEMTTDAMGSGVTDQNIRAFIAANVEAVAALEKVFYDDNEDSLD